MAMSLESKIDADHVKQMSLGAQGYVVFRVDYILWFLRCLL